MKTCIKCGETKPYSGFYEADYGDGYRNDCISCKKKKSIEHYHNGYKDVKIEMEKDRYQKNKTIRLNNERKEIAKLRYERILQERDKYYND